MDLILKTAPAEMRFELGDGLMAEVFREHLHDSVTGKGIVLKLKIAAAADR